MRGVLLVSAVIHSILPAASTEAVADRLATGFIAQPASGHYWAMSSSYRASFDSKGIQLYRHGRSATVHFPGARLHWQTEGEPAGQVNFLGAESRSLTGSAAIRARNAYPGVDIVVRLRDGRLKSEFQLAAGVSSAVAGYCLEGATVRTGSDGQSLRIDAGGGWQWTEEGLESWQEALDGRKLPVQSRFRTDGQCVRFDTSKLDSSLPLTIDPELAFSSYMGGGMFDAITAVATDAVGNLYLGGWTESSDFPSVSGYQTASAGRIDAFVAKVSPSGQLLFSTYFGGSGEDRVQAIVVDSGGIITVAGLTSSTNFPTLSPARGALAGGRDAFVTRLSPAGNQLVFSTYMGGTAHDAALAVTLDSSGNVIVAGETASADFPTQNAYSTTSGGGIDGFVSRFSSAGVLQSSTYFGGGADDRIRGVAVSSDGTMHVTGSTASTNFPVASAPYPSLRGSMDAFYTRFNLAATAVSLSTYLGGAGGSSLSEEAGYGIAIDAVGRAWVAGVTPSTDFPGVSNGYQTSYGGGTADAFVTVFSLAGSLEWSTYIGGTGLDAATSISAGSGFVGLAGYTTSNNLPVTGALQGSRGGEYDAFWAAFPIVSTAPLYVSYIGGTGSDSALATAASGSALAIGGSTLSANFPLRTPIQSSNPGSYGGFVSRLRFGPGPITVSPSSGTGVAGTFTFNLSHASGSSAIVNAAFLFNASYSFPGGCYVYYDRASNLIFLYRDAGSVWMPVTPGAAATVDNGMCSLHGTGLTVTSTTNALTLNIPVTFAAAFAGTKLVFANANDSAGLGADWPQIGTWNIVPVSVPTANAVAPASGTGLAQSFSFTFSDTNGANDIATASFFINNVYTIANGCYVSFNRAANTISLFRDTDSTFLPVTPGVNSTVQNANCSISGSGASAVISGTLLTLTIPVTFKPAFTGPRIIYSSVADAGGLTSDWKAVGTWTPAPLFAPTVSALTPSSGSGAVQTFSLSFSDGNGYADLVSTTLLINSSASTGNGCYLIYNQTANTLSLFRDSDSSFLPLTPGANAVIENPVCSIAGAGVVVAAAGTQLTLTIPVTLKPAVNGARNIYAAATDSGGLSTGYQIVGSWTPYPSYAPSVVSLQPATGTGLSQSFAFRFSDSNGNADIAALTFLFNTSLNTANACYVTYSRSSNSLSLYRDSDSSWTSLTPASAATIENNNCSITGTSFAINASGNDLHVTIPVTFKPGLFGALTAFAAATDQSGLSSGWISAGTWTAAGAAAPAVISVSPNSGTATVQTFTVNVFDANGSTDIEFVRFLINNSVTHVNGCYIAYSRAANTVSLFRDSDSAWLPLTPGSALTVSNDFCTVSGAGLLATASGNSLSLSIPLAFKQSFSGAKTLFAGATDTGGLTSALAGAGTWTLNQTASPSVTSLTPSAGSATAQTFSLILSDFNGNADITSALLLVNSSLNGTNGCFISYNRAANAFYLFRDSDNAWLIIYPGTATSVSNTNCTISGSALAVSGSGSSLTFSLPLSFHAPFSGLKNFYANVSDTAGLSSGWITAGSWTPGQPASPAVLSLSPSAGTMVSQTFTITLSDANGGNNIASALFIVNGAINGQNSCFISYDHAAGAFYLYKDAGNLWQLVYPGSNAAVSNPNCSLAGAGLTKSVSGNSVTLTMPLSLSSSYTGAKNFYVAVTDVGGLSSGWVTAGTWSSAQPAAPTVASVAPSSGAGPSQLFAVTLSDTNGNADIASALLLVNNTLNGQNACFISYNRSANAFYLFRDVDNLWQLIYPGSGASVSNGICTISGATLLASASGNTITLMVPLAFNSGFTGAKNFYASAADSGGLSSGWITAGTWNPSQSSAPTVTSVTPSTGAGASQLFTITLNDTNGNSDIVSALLLINTTLTGQSACFISYNRAANAFYLFRDSDNLWQLLYPGSNASVSNGNCTISGTSLAASASGNVLTLAIPLSFSSSFAGAKNFYASVADAGGLSSDWITAGAWNPASSVAPTVTSVNPSSGKGASQTFALTLADANGNTDMASALILINNSVNGNNACFISYNRSVDAFYLLRDSDGIWQLIYPGSAGSVTNNNCTITGAGLASSVSGNSLTLTLPLSFKPAFAGPKSFFANVTDSTALASGWVAAGTWIVN
jgi:hypothetical protein